MYRCLRIYATTSCFIFNLFFFIHFIATYTKAFRIFVKSKEIKMNAQLHIFNDSQSMADYKKHLGFEYGNIDRLISTLIESISKYQNAPQTEKCIQRVNYYKTILNIAENEKIIKQNKSQN
jgi:superfamily I DNA and/or RNA helicase